MPQYQKINDAYVEKIIETNKYDSITKLLKNKYKKNKLITIDCNNIFTQTDLIKVFKKKLDFPLFCGDNWDAVNDLIYDVIFPNELQIVGWNLLKKRLPNDSEILINILDKIEKSRCTIKYL